MTLNTPQQIKLYRMKTLSKMLRMECLGMKRRGRSAYVIIKEEFELRGNKASVSLQFDSLIEEMT